MSAGLNVVYEANLKNGEKSGIKLLLALQHYYFSNRKRRIIVARGTVKE